MNSLQMRVEIAVRHFWATRQKQSLDQGRQSGRKDQGARSAVTGGAQMNGFIGLAREILLEAGLPESTVFFKRNLEIPGYFRAEKKWDLVVVVDSQLLASIEFKSQVGPSFGNNYNNRTEESLGTATDLWAAYREGAFRPSQRPWLGYLMLLEECPESQRAAKVQEPHFRVFEEFRGASYSQRYEILLTKLLRERLYDGACLLLSDRTGGMQGSFTEPCAELSFQSFTSSLLSRAIAYRNTR
jgi:hypothetical protein